MARVITLDRAIIHQIEILPVREQVVVDYSITDAAERFSTDGRLIYVRVLPAEPAPAGVEYVLLTQEQYDYLVVLYEAILSDVNARI